MEVGLALHSGKTSSASLSPSKFGPGFGKSPGSSLRFKYGRHDHRYHVGEYGCNEHLKGRFGAELTTHMPSSIGIESDSLAHSQQNRASVSAWLQPPSKTAHPGFSFSAADYRTPDPTPAETLLPPVTPPWARTLSKTSSERGLTRLLDERKGEDTSREVQPEDLQPYRNHSPDGKRSQRHTKLGPGFYTGERVAPRFPPIKDTTFVGPVRKRAGRRPFPALRSSQSQSSLATSQA